ncbi:MAG TPA: enoyl-CoA hydratase-related protein [Solirubrobacterales bacterium]|nr:enoyl-CoA hydratase-related protein [Solirubrobacterales bacterium]
MAIDPNSYDFLVVSIVDRIAFVAMGRPDQMGACDEDGHREFARILRDVAADDGVDVAVVHGTGSSFSVGAEYEWMEEVTRADELQDDLQIQVRELVRAHVALDKPVVSAINGPATGSGLMLALLSDWVIAEEGVKLADGHIRAALAAGDGGVLVWPLAVGLTRAKRYLMTGDWIDAVEAERIGLLTEVVPAGTSLDRATEVAGRFAAMPRQAVRATKSALNHWLEAGLGNGFEYSVAQEMQSFSREGEAVREAVDDIRSRRRPAWW